MVLATRGGNEKMIKSKRAAGPIMSLLHARNVSSSCALCMRIERFDRSRSRVATSRIK